MPLLLKHNDGKSALLQILFNEHPTYTVSRCLFVDITQQLQKYTIVLLAAGNETEDGFASKN